MYECIKRKFPFHDQKVGCPESELLIFSETVALREVISLPIDGAKTLGKNMQWTTADAAVETIVKTSESRKRNRLLAISDSKTTFCSTEFVQFWSLRATLGLRRL